LGKAKLLKEVLFEFDNVENVVTHLACLLKVGRVFNFLSHAFLIHCRTLLARQKFIESLERETEKIRVF
jgi:hypothetical protein